MRPAHSLPFAAILLSVLFMGCVDGGTGSARDVFEEDIDVGPSCTTAETLCDGRCVDSTKDDENCGACGTTCGVDEACVAGACVLDCPSSQTDCGGTCRDLQSSIANCGSCDNACAAGKVCSAGTCQTSCGGALIECDGGCRDLTNDRANCGSCADACPVGEVCTEGVCAVECVSSQTLCSGVCRDLQSDPKHCGDCATTCDGGELCASGACATSCDAGNTDCSGVCRNLQADNTNCGTCGAVCPVGEACVSGACITRCVGGTSNCSGVCRDLQNDNTSCGSCGNACAPGLLCSGGVCAAECVGGTTDCGGVCRDLQVDPNHCGTCATLCPSNNALAACDGGTCLAFCDPGAVDCDGDASNACEAVLDSDVDHCSACNVVCPAAPNSARTCSLGACGYACDAGFGDCDAVSDNGCEAALDSDVGHCGACGAVCPSNNALPTCDTGACSFACDAGFQDCDADPANACETNLNLDRANCGGCGIVCSSSESCVAGTCEIFTCFSFTNTAAEDLTGNTWFDPCVTAPGTKVRVLVSDPLGNAVYDAVGTKVGTWTFDNVTTDSALGNQYDSAQHNRLVTLNNGDLLVIAGKSSDNSGCGGSHGNGYGLRVYSAPLPPVYYDNIKLEVIPFRQTFGGSVGALRNFGSWTELGELSWTGGGGMYSCFPFFGSGPSLTGFLGSVEISILP